MEVFDGSEERLCVSYSSVGIAVVFRLKWVMEIEVSEHQEFVLGVKFADSLPQVRACAGYYLVIDVENA